MTDNALNPPVPQLRRAAAALASPWTITLAVPVLVAVLDPARLAEVVAEGTGAFATTLPYIALAVLLIAWLKAAGAETVIARAFAGPQWRMILAAAAMGGLAPFCSCEVIPFIAGLLALGAPISAVMAFWLASPLVDPPSFLITAGALGWSFAVAKVVLAVAMGVAGGFALAGAQRAGLLGEILKPLPGTGCGCGAPRQDGRPAWRFWHSPDRRAVFRTEAWANARFLVKWLALAYALQALLVAYVPADLIAGLVGGDGAGPVVVAALVGMPAYLNGYVAPPLLAGLIDQGMTPGAAMAFMMAGAVSSIPAMAAVWSLVRPPVFATYLGLGLGGAILGGLAFGLLA